MSHVTLLTLVGRIHPQAWDAIFPHGPVVRDQAWLRPVTLSQPIEFSAAEMTAEMVRAAVHSEVSGGSPYSYVSEFIDDWCGTPWPRRWPWPWPGPRPEFGPRPEPWDLQTARVVGAIVLASAASRLDSELGKILGEGAERLAEVAVTG